MFLPLILTYCAVFLNMFLFYLFVQCSLHKLLSLTFGKMQFFCEYYCYLNRQFIIDAERCCFLLFSIFLSSLKIFLIFSVIFKKNCLLAVECSDKMLFHRFVLMEKKKKKNRSVEKSKRRLVL